jgi:ATP/maltotriose-dependent transcriptional regulator MalT
VRVSRPLLLGFLIEALLDRGELAEAERIVCSAGFPEEPPPNVLVGMFQIARARFRVETGDLQRGVDELLRVGEIARTTMADNPAFRPWRRWAAEAMRRLGRVDTAEALALEERELAERWGAVHATGASVRELGLIVGGSTGEQLLRDATDMLANSNAPVEHARALAELGAALRRSNKRTEARTWLREAVESAGQIGAVGIAERANQELAATGARPRKLLQTGVDALTASERRVAGLAAEGLSNKEIAQLLFVTVKTVEVHLSSVYRKLQIDARGQLGAALVGTRPTVRPRGALGVR